MKFQQTLNNELKSKKIWLESFKNICLHLQKRRKDSNKTDRAASKADTKVFSEHLYASHTYFVILVNVELWRAEINIIRVVKYEYYEYFKL